MTGLWIGLGGLVVGAAAGVALASLQNARRRRRARSLARRARAAEHMAEVGAMTSGLAHEIKNPLSTLVLNAQLLRESVGEMEADGSVKARLQRRTEALEREAERLKGILTDFLAYAGELRLSPERADIGRLIEDLVDFFHPQAEQSGVRLRADLPPRAVAAVVDVPHIKQALLNLMLNAVQAMTGRHAAPDAPRELILRAAAADDEHIGEVVRIHVTDTGPGMTPEVLREIFKPYFTTRAGGTGLGLPTTRRIAEAHGGRLIVHSEPGRGSDFCLVLPIEGPPEQARSKA